MSLAGKTNGQTLVGSLNKCDLLTISAYGIAVKHGYKGTEEEWLLSLQGGAVVDKTLKIDGVAADAKAAGVAIRANTAAINEFKASVPGILNEHVSDRSNPHAVTKAQVGLGNVDNTSDANKPVSTAQATAIADAKKAGTDAQTAAENAQTSADNANTAIENHVADKNNPHEITCDQIGAASLAYTDTKTSMTLLWENASPTSDFAAQTISLNLSGYDGVKIVRSNKENTEAYRGADGNFYQIADATVSYINYKEDYMAVFIERPYTPSNTGITFINCEQIGFMGGKWGSGTDRNDLMKPLKIYGIKGAIE